MQIDNDEIKRFRRCCQKIEIIVDDHLDFEAIKILRRTAVMTVDRRDVAAESGQHGGQPPARSANFENLATNKAPRLLHDYGCTTIRHGPAGHSPLLQARQRSETLDQRRPVRQRKNNALVHQSVEMRIVAPEGMAEMITPSRTLVATQLVIDHILERAAEWELVKRNWQRSDSSKGSCDNALFAHVAPAVVSNRQRLRGEDRLDLVHVVELRRQ